MNSCVTSCLIENLLPAEFLDYQEFCLRAASGFMGITDVTIIRAENVNVGPEKRTKPLAASAQEIAALSQ